LINVNPLNIDFLKILVNISKFHLSALFDQIPNIYGEKIKKSKKPTVTNGKSNHKNGAHKFPIIYYTSLKLNAIFDPSHFLDSRQYSDL